MCIDLSIHVTYGVYVSQLVRISRICDNYVSFVKRHQLLTKRLIKQGFWYSKLSVSFKVAGQPSNQVHTLFSTPLIPPKKVIRMTKYIPFISSNSTLSNYPICFLIEHRLS